jgi:hypothetical protein
MIPSRLIFSISLTPSRNLISKEVIDDLSDGAIQRLRLDSSWHTYLSSADRAQIGMI